ncbi:MAG TPA: type I 3-dehydroquinate dehydratase, partial [Acidobacteriota bacterium]|nr:type I 3-dehydroquinate dehydratase [Acidobacteriota bacterium]
MRICLSLFGTTEELCEAISQGSDADLYEIRLDLSQKLDYARIRTATKKPLIFTALAGDDRLSKAAKFADYVDAGPKPTDFAQPIVSVHAGEADPDALWATHSGEAITKIVLQTANYDKIERLIELDREHPGLALCFAMGDVGAFSRILSCFAGAPWIYASQDRRPTAPGQFTLRELVEVYRVRRFAAQPRLYGIAGDPVTHSRSPQFHNDAFALAQLPWMYLPFRCTDLPALLRHAQAF